MIDPRSVPCPRCSAPVGRYCRRPSGHSGPFVAPHKARREAAAALAPPEPPTNPTDCRTPYELARDLIRSEVEAGAPYSWLRQQKTRMGHRDYEVAIEKPSGQSVWRPGWASDHIVVTRAQGRDCHEVFSMREIYDAIRGHTDAGQLMLF